MNTTEAALARVREVFAAGGVEVNFEHLKMIIIDGKQVLVPANEEKDET